MDDRVSLTGRGDPFFEEEYDWGKRVRLTLLERWVPFDVVRMQFLELEEVVFTTDLSLGAATRLAERIQRLLDMHGMRPEGGPGAQRVLTEREAAAAEAAKVAGRLEGLLAPGVQAAGAPADEPTDPGLDLPSSAP